MRKPDLTEQTREEIENEQTFLRLILNSNENVDSEEAESAFDAIDKTPLAPEDFFEPKHQCIFAVMQKLVENGLQPNYGRVFTELLKNKTFKETGGFSYLLDLCSYLKKEIPICYHSEFLAGKIREQGINRRCLATLSQKIEAFRRGEITAEELSASPIITETDGKEQDVSAFKNNSSLLETLRKMDAGTWENPAFPTGFETLDRMLSGGFLPGGLYVIGGYPGTGKTAFCTNILANAYERNTNAPDENAALFVSFEMTNDEIIKRIVASLARSPFPKTQAMFDHIKRHNRKGIENLISTLGSIQTQDCLIWSYPNVKNAEMLSREILRVSRRFKPKAVFIDYLQIIPDESGADAFGRAGVAARLMKTLAGNLGVPVIVLSQLNNNSANEKREPGLQDFRNSGEIAAAADVCLIFYENKNLTDEEKAISRSAKPVFCKIAKNRDGRSGADVTFEFNGETMRFSDKGLKAASPR